MHRVETFSTAGYARAERIAYWNDVAASAIGPLVIEALDHDGFSAGMKRVCLRNCEILPPTSVAFDSGFNDPNTFCRLFRRKFGVAPRGGPTAGRCIGEVGFARRQLPCASSQDAAGAAQ